MHIFDYPDYLLKSQRRLRVVPHFSSGIAERAKRERVKITPREKRRHAAHFSLSPPRVAFSHVG